MIFLPLGDVKSHLSELVGRVHDQHERVTVTVHGRPSAILIAPEDLEALEETLAIMRDAATMNRLPEADAELARGEYVSAEELTETMRRRQALWATGPQRSCQRGQAPPVQTLPGGAVDRRLTPEYERHAELAAIIRFGVLHQSGRLGNSCRTEQRYDVIRPPAIGRGHPVVVVLVRRLSGVCG